MSNRQIKCTLLNKLILLLVVITFLLTIIKRHSQLGIFSESSSSSKHNICSMIQFFMYNVPNFTQSTNPDNVRRVCSASLWCTAALEKRNFKCEWRFESINLFQQWCSPLVLSTTGKDITKTSEQSLYLLNFQWFQAILDGNK